MTCCSHVPLQIGEVLDCIHQYDEHGIAHNVEQPFVVVREVAFEDWYKDQLGQFGPPPAGWKPPQDCWFYEITTD